MDLAPLEISPADLTAGPGPDVSGLSLAAVPFEGTEAAWHEWRRGGVGGSDIAALLGLSRWASPTSLYYEKTGAVEDRSEDTERQRIGKRMEAVLAAEFNDRTGLWCVGEQTWCQHPSYSWARCTVDGFAADSPYGSIGPGGDLALGTVQMKTDGRFGWPDGIPANVRAQCVWEMGVTCQQHCWLIVMFAGFRVEVFEIDWHDEERSDWLYMLEAARAFWVDHVQALVPPPVDDHEATTAALTEVYGPDPAGELDADDEARSKVLAVQLAMAATGAAEANEVRCKNVLREYLGAKTDLVDGWLMPKTSRGKPKRIVLASWRPQSGSKLNIDAFRSAMPATASKFTETTESRVLRVPSLKEPAQ